MDITNAPMANPSGFVPDTFSVYVQLEGGFSRMNIFANYASDRDPDYVDVILDGAEQRSRMHFGQGTPFR